MNKWFELILGLILLIGVILIAWYSSVSQWTILGKDLNFLHSAWIFLKGGIFWFVALLGLLFIILGISDLKE
ncbi:MAG: hypothetical protein QF567_00390 [Candidatus Pacearchaeota archaeon]|jgi:hypothetical protein|nr:hypothetical protein [Candidatus Pacearchaeota archaeon]MDP7520679.1 hypothetical protein [Candidatus Pacearchaeota archaeon]|tara:strand:- start:2465 stop:2680 length:216 start_codon:yes stop_codon:yes gene_type:complete